ncbi:MAG: hypothetical protein KKF78_08395 [Candidatus Omnitrophica bacterium]|nr:hypothetical protein [Candidatus Omnitrophota bacterium]MBU1997158.1 hypothetical protein [Candidatus Omnitrophota bacterium]
MIVGEIEIPLPTKIQTKAIKKEPIIALIGKFSLIGIFYNDHLTSLFIMMNCIKNKANERLGSAAFVST